MRLSRTIGSLIATALVATPLTVIAAAAPATAATPTKVVMKVSPAKMRFGDQISVSGEVRDSSGTQLPYGSGSVALQFKKHGSKSWKTLQTDDQGYTFYFYPVKISAPGSLRVRYNGNGTYSPDTASKGLKVQRNVNYKEIPGRALGIQGTIKPKGKVKISVLRKSGRSYRPFKTVHSAKTGKFKVILPAPRSGSWHWKIIFQGSKGYQDSVVKGRTYRI